MHRSASISARTTRKRSLWRWSLRFALGRRAAAVGHSRSAKGRSIKASPAAETATPPASEGVCVIVLAAGASVRLGQPKQLLPYQGKTLLRHATEMALSVGQVTVVLGAHAEQIAPTLDGLPVTIVLANDWQEGMAASLRAGITAARAISV